MYIFVASVIEKCNKCYIIEIRWPNGNEGISGAIM